MIMNLIGKNNACYVIMSTDSAEYYHCMLDILRIIKETHWKSYRSYQKVFTQTDLHLCYKLWDVLLLVQEITSYQTT